MEAIPAHPMPPVQTQLAATPANVLIKVSKEMVMNAQVQNKKNIFPHLFTYSAYANTEFKWTNNFMTNSSVSEFVC